MFLPSAALARRSARGKPLFRFPERSEYMGWNDVARCAERRGLSLLWGLAFPSQPEQHPANMKFLTVSSRHSLVLSGPTRGASGDPYLVGSLVASGTRERRRASGGIT